MKKLLLTFAFGSVVFLAACGGGAQENNATAKPEGETIVMRSCASCHGGQLQGMRNTPALNDVGSRLSEEEILDIILNGTSNGMPPGLIKGEDAEKAAAWLAEQK
ncbi:cytochrome c [Metasolibacillus meyeri]|uniref:Cytochrome c n=1 Tax=Metasolibacillus meyeri TaxID=1071052 RepID=A0AAW9NVR9_9BACL|nr:cytochrome c [Metasolibacillus meyeri]MEC1180672.1 cytochrome c [Metasolibacillus meyeri]